MGEKLGEHAGPHLLISLHSLAPTYSLPNRQIFLKRFFSF